MLAALQEEEKMRELRAMIQEQKAIYQKLVTDRKQTEKLSRQQANILVNETQKSREFQIQLRNANKDRKSNELAAVKMS